MTQQINLYNEAFEPERELLTARSLAGTAAILLVLVGAAATWAQAEARAHRADLAVAQAAKKMTQERLDLARREAEARKPSAALQAEVDRKRALLVLRDEVLAALQGGMGDATSGAGFSEYLRGLGRQSVNGLWLTGFAVSAGGADMSLRGRTIDKALLPDYVRRLNAEKAFAGKSFAGLHMEAKSAAVSPAAGTPSGDMKTTAPGIAIVTPVAAAAMRTPGMSGAPAQASPAGWVEFQLAATADETKK